MSGDSPTISLIWAMAENRVIGRNNQLPWHLSADLQHFKRLTLGKPIVMGRKTWESLPGLLPKRQHIVVTGNRGYRAEGALVVHSIDEAVAAAGDVQEIMIVGGGAFYAQMLPRADRLYLTLVHTEVEGDAWFPEFDLSAWREVGREDFSADKKNRFAYSFITLEREN
ncbi:MAG: type 3 dihydrofolate reductase [endosymbiont of Seepiophila jonesi]|uniref:Dihydrofolate reductase n=1 Tax=endosymbiont of Lamellibrachia luymesi TaxID=2200907 RepID=A0A370DUP8_9GAMM|nr:MAG: type 3 dihydrofolate reductase [endosymbiont of Lamellibrachia luymesi]RDH91600.1 MAG: type 3 dihydrofolate reductase [endosymbiont of Seepiophila jonesi]